MYYFGLLQAAPGLLASIIMKDVVEAPRRLTLTFGGSTQELVEESIKWWSVVDMAVWCGIMRW